MVTLGTPDRGTLLRFPRLLVCNREWGSVCWGVFKVHSAGHPLNAGELLLKFDLRASNNDCFKISIFESLLVRVGLFLFLALFVKTYEHFFPNKISYIDRVG